MAVTVERAIPFAEKEGFRHLEMDVYRSDAQGDERWPLIHYVHGGGWRVSSRQRAPRETRAWQPDMFSQLAEAGFVVAANDYRFSGEALFPAAIEDTTDALTWLRTNADRFGLDPTRVVLFGQSAGGYLVAAVGLDPSIPPVQAIVCWYPLTDFSVLADDDSAADFPAAWLGAPLSTVPELVEASRVPRLARADAPPVLLQHGTADAMAPYEQSVILHDALASAGARVELETVEGADHFFAGADDETIQRLFDHLITFAKTCTT